MPGGATVARLTPDQKVACSNHVRVILFYNLVLTQFVVLLHVNFYHCKQFILVFDRRTLLLLLFLVLVLSSWAKNSNSCLYKFLLWELVWLLYIQCEDRNQIMYNSKNLILNLLHFWDIPLIFYKQTRTFHLYNLIKYSSNTLYQNWPTIN